MFFKLLCIAIVCSAKDDVLVNHVMSTSDMQAQDIAIIQFDTRKLDDYWGVSVRWNKAYADRWGHPYLLFSLKDTRCTYEHLILSPVWCKVKAMQQAPAWLPRAKAFVYLDSDAVVTSNYSLAHIISFMREELKWNFQSRPVAFNLEHHGWSCKSTLELGFPHCFNSGVILWLNTARAVDIINQWWHSAGLPYTATPFQQKWREFWPWEQAPLHVIYMRNADSIMVLSFPTLPFLPWTSKKNPRAQYPTDPIDPWCFTHWPGAECFITHHCASRKQKGKIIERYDWWRDEPEMHFQLSSIVYI